MTGLEKILSQIEYDSNDRCRSIIAQAEEKAESIKAEAEEQAKAIAAESEAAAEKQLDNIRQSAESSAQLNKSKIILKAKLEAIDDMLAKALDDIKNLPEKEYFEILKTLVINNAKEGEGVLCLSAYDEKRLPEDFISSVNSELASGKSVTLDLNGHIIDRELYKYESGGAFVIVQSDATLNIIDSSPDTVHKGLAVKGNGTFSYG